MTHRLTLLAVSSALAGCAVTPADDVTAGAADLSVHRQIDPAPAAAILATSADRRWVAYGAACTAAAPVLRLYDEASGTATELAEGIPCRPGAVTFSPDGSLLAFGDGAGHVFVHDALADRTALVSRPEGHTIGLAFSPDSQWFVVATAEPAPLAATLDAWDRGLATHVAIAHGALYDPFAPPAQSLQFSPDGSGVVFLGALASPPPAGTLMRWTRADGQARAIAAGVPAGGYVVRDDGGAVAYLATSSAVPPTAAGPVGSLVALDLATGLERVIAVGVAATPLAFANGTLLYAVHGATSSAPVTLVACDLATGLTALVDTGVFAGPGASPIAVGPAGDRIAYARDYDPTHRTAELRVAAGVDFTLATTIAARAVPAGGYGWLAGGGALGYLHDPSATAPGAAVGALGVWDAASATSHDLATDVAQAGLAFDAGAADLLFASGYDATSGAGALQAWSAATGATRLLAHHAEVGSAQQGPDATLAAFLALAPPDAAPGSRLDLAYLAGAPRTVQVAAPVTSLSLGWYGRIVYTTDDGVYDAVAR